MGFRTLELGKACELHIKNSQLEIVSEEGTALIPVEDLDHILAHGANIRLSTMDLSILTKNKVALTTLDDKYLPTAVVLPFEGHARQSRLMHAQVRTAEGKNKTLWTQIVRQKICNQSRALSILGLEKAEEVAAFSFGVTTENADMMEAQAAKVYFAAFHEGMNRRSDDPVNSRLNYGYAVVRSYIARSLAVAGFHPTFGIHHNSQLNAFNLADDLIEPLRAAVDLVVHAKTGTNTLLSKTERRDIAHVLHNACISGDVKVNVMTAVGNMIDSLRRIILDDSDEALMLPVVLPVESLEGISE